MILNNFVEMFAEYCGATRYARFVETLRSSRTSVGRLFYWQEELLRQFEAERGVATPKDLESVLALYRIAPLQVPPFAMPGEAAHAFRIPGKVRRLFRWVNQHASGGSHVTEFGLALESPSGDECISVVDLAAPHERPDVAAELVRAIADGASEFGAACASNNVALRSLRISLLQYTDHAVDLKPWKYTPATFFLLQDLYGEVKLDRFIELKLVGVPL